MRGEPVANEEEAKTFRIGLSVGGVILVCGLLVTVGKQLSTIENNHAAVSEIRTDLRSIRDYIDKRTEGRYKIADAAQDLDYVNRRLQQIENRIDKLEASKP